MILALIFIAVLLVLGACSHKASDDPVNDEPIDGGRTEVEGNPDSKPLEGEILSFELSRDGDFELSFEVENDEIIVQAIGGNTDERDGTFFRLEYATIDKELPFKVNELILKYELYKNNGHTVMVGGLPFGIGETLKVKYEGGTLYRSNNQNRILSDEEAMEFYKLFKNDAVLNGYGFDSAGSNLELYDDPSVEFLQGIFSGNHFGREMVVEFEGNHVTIFYDGKLTDDVDYLIIENTIVPDVLRDKPIGNRERDKYEYFNSCTCLSKALGDRLTAHFYINKSNSSCELIRQ